MRYYGPETEFINKNCSILLNHGSATSCNYDMSGIHTSAHLTLFFTELRCKKEGGNLQNNSEKM